MKFNPIIGNAQNKLGNMVLYTRGGTQYGRVYVPNPRNPRTAAQIQARAMLREMSKTASQLACLVKRGFSPYANGRTTAQNKFIELNRGAFTYDENAGTISVTYSDLIVAKGPVAEVSFGTPNFTDPKTIKIPVVQTFNESCNAKATDVVWVGVYFPERRMSVMTDAPMERGTLTSGEDTLIIQNLEGFVGMKGYVFGFVLRSDGELSSSNSSYIGMGTVS